MYAMYSDTHFHFQMTVDGRGQDGAHILSAMAARDCFFGLDIGTQADDLDGRLACAERAVAAIPDREAAERCRAFLHFSAGIWPHPEEIRERGTRIALLKDCVNRLSGKDGTKSDGGTSAPPCGNAHGGEAPAAGKNAPDNRAAPDSAAFENGAAGRGRSAVPRPAAAPAADGAHAFPVTAAASNSSRKAAAADSARSGRRIIAVGECGLDHHWNPSGADGRCEDDFDRAMLAGERELFEMQLEYAKELDLPVIVHSRDAFDDTLSCIQNVGGRGIIHCFSYGKREAAAFLDLGWHISFSGSVTYAKKNRLEETAELLRFVPADRLLCETDAPYLAPVPFRGQTNTPPLVEHTYGFIAGLLGIPVPELCRTVDANIRALFRI